MPRKSIPSRSIRIHRRLDGKFVSRGESPSDSPLGVDSNLHVAIGSALREATLMSRDGFRVIIEVEQENGQWKQEGIVEPPANSP